MRESVELWRSAVRRFLFKRVVIENRHGNCSKGNFWLTQNGGAAFKARKGCAGAPEKGKIIPGAPQTRPGSGPDCSWKNESRGGGGGEFQHKSIIQNHQDTTPSHTVKSHTIPKEKRKFLREISHEWVPTATNCTVR